LLFGENGPSGTQLLPSGTVYPAASNVGNILNKLFKASKDT